MPARSLSVAALSLVLLTGAAPKTTTCLMPPTPEPIDWALKQTGLSATDAERIRILRAAVDHHLATRNIPAARQAVLEAMTIMRYAYEAGPPPAKRGQPCQPGKWHKMP